MRFYLNLLFFVLLSFDSAAYWQTYQNDLKNSGFSNGTGYFPLKTSNFSTDLGMDFQLLADDLDANGNSEIALFSNNSLIILNPQLEALAQIKTGSLLGQPTLFNFDNDDFIEVIFNSRQASGDYFFAYQYNNSNLYQEFNITLGNDANFSGIKCFNFNGSNLCTFKDRQNYVHVVNLNSKTDSSYMVSAYNETRQTVPAIGNIDNDENPEAVFWLNNDSANGYGFLAFDLAERKIDWIVDDVFRPLILGESLFHQLFSLKGQPVLVDLDNDNRMEIAASVFYDDYRNGENTVDWFTELLVYGGNGTKLFSKCETNTILDVGCNIGSNVGKKMEGTNPFVLDYDRNGADDVCFVKDVKKFIGVLDFDYMAMSCYNHSGNEIAKVKLSSLIDGIKGTAMAADMNNDGEKDIITSNDIYMLNGTSIFDFSLVNVHPVAVDIDGNSGLDLIWTNGNKTKVFLDSKNYSIDLAVYPVDIGFFKFNTTHINVSAVIRNFGIEAKNVKAVLYNTETLEKYEQKVGIRKNMTFSAILGLKENEKVLLIADPDNELNESDENNNFALKEFMGLPNVYVYADVQPSNLNSLFKEYLKNNLISGYYTDKESEADVIVNIGKYNPHNRDNNINYLSNYDIGYDSGNVIHNDEKAVNPYSGLVFGVFDDDIFSDGRVTISIVGNEIEGEIAAVKEFVRNQATFLNLKDKEAVFVGDENLNGLKIYDYLHLGGNEEHYGKNDDSFRNIVRNTLNDNMFNVEDKTVVGNGISLRLRNLKPNISADYLEYLNSTGIPVEMPVVLASGLFSNLTSWEVLGAELSNIGRDTWLIEITGGPGQDCNDCIDYSFYNLTDIFVPALLNGVLNFTGKNKMQYVGFSNGCRSALDSLERNKFDSNKVETFVAVGCPGSFNHSKDTDSASPISKVLNKDGGSAITSFRNKNLKHVSFSDLAKEIVGIERFFDDKIKISVNLFQQYYNWSVDTSDKEPGENVAINRFFAIQGNLFTNSDGVVSTYDINKTYSNINANKKKYINIPASHLGIDDATRTKVFVRKILNNETFTSIENLIYVLKSEP